ncbi:MAG: GldG family protein [Methylotenera sp.]|nr:Gldg family protein [Methylotenera sp.]NOU24883.1 GldG family protein [Methylotenera sp.]
MTTSKKLQLQILIQHPIFVLFFLVLIALLGFSSYKFHILQDVTQDNRNSVSDGSVNILNQMHGAISITAFAPDDEAFRQNIKNFIGRYQRTKSDIQLNFINSATDPKLAQEAGIKAKGGELVIEYQKRTEHLIPPYTEQDVSNVLMRLTRTHEQAVMALNGHGERDFSSNNSQDFGTFGQQLLDKGFKLSHPNLITESNLVKNGAMLVIASPKANFTAIEVAKIKTYLDAGGNLLWLLDDENLRGLDEIATYIGLEVAQGLVVDKSAVEFGGNLKTAFGVQYGDHPVTENFRIRTSFPEARKISAHGTYENGWKVQELVRVAPNGWLETTPFRSESDIKTINFDAKKDVAGPINIALAIERKYGKKGQRVVVIGNADFLSNTFIINGGNLALGLNIVNWLVGDDHLITIPPTIIKDGNLNLTSESNYKPVFIGFQILLPLGLLIYGFFTWWKRRKA